MTAAGLVAGVITVQGDGTYQIAPPKGPFGNPATATSWAQARFEQKYPTILATMTADVQATVVDTTTSPPTTNKGRVMQNLAAQINGDVAADFGYITNNAVATISVSTSLNLVVPTPNTAGTSILAGTPAVILPVT